MAEVDNRLLIRRLRAVVDASASGGSASEEQWSDAAEVFAATAWEDTEIAAALQERNASALEARVKTWDSTAQPLPPHDRAVLKRALKAFRKRLKAQRLDDESRIGGGPFSKGRESSIVAIQPPSQYPSEVWEELDRRGQLRHDGQGFYELVDG